MESVAFTSPLTSGLQNREAYYKYIGTIAVSGTTREVYVVVVHPVTRASMYYQLPKENCRWAVEVLSRVIKWAEENAIVRVNEKGVFTRSRSCRYKKYDLDGTRHWQAFTSALFESNRETWSESSSTSMLVHHQSEHHVSKNGKRHQESMMVYVPNPSYEDFYPADEETHVHSVRMLVEPASSATTSLLSFGFSQILSCPPSPENRSYTHDKNNDHLWSLLESSTGVFSSNPFSLSTRVTRDCVQIQTLVSIGTPVAVSPTNNDGVQALPEKCDAFCKDLAVQTGTSPVKRAAKKEARETYATVRERTQEEVEDASERMREKMADAAESALYQKMQTANKRWGDKPASPKKAQEARVAKAKLAQETSKRK